MTILLFGSGSLLAWTAALLADVAPTCRVVIVESPDPELLGRVLREPPTALVVIDPPRSAQGVGTAGTDADRQFVEELRAGAQRAVFALEVARQAPRVLVYSDQFAEPTAWIAALAQVADVSLTRSVNEVLQQLPAPAHHISPLLFAQHERPTLPEAWRESLENYLDPLVIAAGGGNLGTLTWRREILLDGDAMGQLLPAVVEVAGRARILVFGPYLPLPIGPWCMTAFIGFSPDIGHMPFILEIDSGGALTRGFFEVYHGGIFSLSLDFQVAKPLHAVEIRLISQDSALEGQLALIELRLEPHVQEAGAF